MQGMENWISQRCLAKVFLLQFVCSLAAADTLVTSDGGRLTGKVSFNEATSTYVLEFPSGSKVALAKASVTNHIKTSPALEEYRGLAASVDDTADGHFELSKWCRQKNLVELSQRHLYRVVELQPDHAPARAALKQTKFHGEWIAKDQVERLRGKVYLDGKWQIPEVAAIAEVDDGQQRTRSSYQIRIKRLRGSINSRSGTEKAWDELTKITDPLASTAVKDWVSDLLKKPGGSKREMYICLDLLSQWDTPDAINSLSWFALCDDPPLREGAIKLLKEKSPYIAAGYFSSELKSNNNVTVRRAAIALAQMGVGDYTLPLIDALVTKHKHVRSKGGGNINTGFSQDGQGSFGFGKNTEEVSEIEQNQEVLNILLALNPGVDFRFDENAWRTWYGKKADYLADIRRDP